MPNDEVFDLATSEALFINKDQTPVSEDEQVPNDLERNLDRFVRQENTIEFLPRLIRREVACLAEYFIDQSHSVPSVPTAGPSAIGVVTVLTTH